LYLIFFSSVVTSVDELLKRKRKNGERKRNWWHRSTRSSDGESEPHSWKPSTAGDWVTPIPRSLWSWPSRSTAISRTRSLTLLTRQTHFHPLLMSALLSLNNKRTPLFVNLVIPLQFSVFLFFLLCSVKLRCRGVNPNDHPVKSELVSFFSFFFFCNWFSGHVLYCLACYFCCWSFGLICVLLSCLAYDFAFFFFPPGQVKRVAEETGAAYAVEWRYITGF